MAPGNRRGAGAVYPRTMRAVALAAALLLVALGAGCGDDDADEATGRDTPPATTTAEATSVANDSMTPGGGTEVPAAEVEAALAELFRPIAAAAARGGSGDEAGVMWTLALTPPLPLAWPPAPGARWVRWAYAQGMELQLADAVRVARVWGSAELVQGSPMATVRVSMPQLSAWPDPQGVRPLSGEEAADRGRLGEAGALALELTREPDAATADLLRRTYGGWVADNGVIVQSLPDAHDAFLAWLAEEPVR